MEPSSSPGKRRSIARARPAAARRAAAPLRVHLPPETHARLEGHAKMHGVEIEAAARALIDERLQELDDARTLEEARDWQRERALATLEKISAGDLSEVSEDEIDEDFAEALKAARATSGNRPRRPSA